jgi:hypothetical protein
MKVQASARSLLLAAACISALQGGCSYSRGGPPPGYKSSNGSSNSTDGVQQTSYDEEIQSGEFSRLIADKGVAGCMTITEDQVPTNYFETVGVATAAGAVLLALLGAAAGAVLSSNHGSGAAQGAIIGGVAGAGLGAVSGVQTAEQKKFYAVQLARYDCQLEAAQSENGSLESASKQLQASVGTLTRQLDQLEDDYANKRLTRVQAQKELSDIDASSAALKTRMAAMKSDTDKYQQYSAKTQQLAQGTQKAIDDARVDALDDQIAEMRDRNEQLEKDYDELLERRKAVVLK